MSLLAKYQAGQREEQCKGEGRGEEKAAGAQQLRGKPPDTNQEQQQCTGDHGVLCLKAVTPSQGAVTVSRLVLRQDLRVLLIAWLGGPTEPCQGNINTSKI